MAKVKAKQLNLAEELKDILAEYSKELYESKEQALDTASDYLVGELEKASPISVEGDTGKRLKNSWLRTTKYKGVRYVGNSKVGSTNKYGYGIPLVNLLEFGSKGKPFVRKTFEAKKNTIIAIIKGGLSK